MTTETVIIPMPDGRALALELAAYQAALDRGREIVGARSEAATAALADQILDAHGMEQLTGVPESWWLEAARGDRVPCIRAGKYVRFRVAAAIAALEGARR